MTAEENFDLENITLEDAKILIMGLHSALIGTAERAREERDAPVLILIEDTDVHVYRGLDDNNTIKVVSAWQQKKQLTAIEQHYQLKPVNNTVTIR